MRAYALKHPEMRHRELAWRMVDEDVACLSPSTVYRILREENLVCPWRRRTKRSREDEEKAQRPNQSWATDLMYVRIGGRRYYLVSFLDEYSRYIVHYELVTSMDGKTVSLEAQRAVETLPRDAHGAVDRAPRDAHRQRQLLRLAGVPRSAGRARAGASADQAALPGGERPDGTGQPHAA